MYKVLSVFLLFQTLSHGGVVPQQYQQTPPPPESSQSLLANLLNSLSGETGQPQPSSDYGPKAAAGPAEKSYGDGYDSSYSGAKPAVNIVPAPTTRAPYAKSGSGSSPAINCREFTYSRANTQAACAAVSQRDIVAGIISSSSDIGYCRWDTSVGVCWCPRPQNLCNDLKQCYWNKDPSLTGNAASYYGSSKSNSGECISNAERFYVILSNLLLKRGKKDFAIRINYSSAPAKGQLPMGPYGPAIIGAGSSGQSSYPSSYSGSSYPQQAVYGQAPQQISYLQAPQVAYTQQAYAPQIQYPQQAPYQAVQPNPYSVMPYSQPPQQAYQAVPYH